MQGGVRKTVQQASKRLRSLCAWIDSCLCKCAGGSARWWQAGGQTACGKRVRLQVSYLQVEAGSRGSRSQEEPFLQPGQHEGRTTLQLWATTCTM